MKSFWIILVTLVYVVGVGFNIFGDYGDINSLVYGTFGFLLGSAQANIIWGMD